MKKMDHNTHSVSLLYYHLVMVVKYRRKVIDDQISERAKEVFEYIVPNHGKTLEGSFLESEFLPYDCRRCTT